MNAGGNEAEASVVEPMGNENFLYMGMGDLELTARIANDLRPAPGETVRFEVDEAALYLFDVATGEALKTMTDETDVAVGEYTTTGGE